MVRVIYPVVIKRGILLDQKFFFMVIAKNIVGHNLYVTRHLT